METAFRGVVQSISDERWRRCSRQHTWSAGWLSQGGTCILAERLFTTIRRGLLEPSTSRADRSLSFSRCDRVTVARVSDTWPLPGPPQRLPTLERVRDLWQLRGITSNVTAAIWRNDFGLELRVENNGERDCHGSTSLTRVVGAEGRPESGAQAGGNPQAPLTS
jgi:hypothetical protein